MSQRFLNIHGHFYQPPRENPWTEVIDRQHSASPYRDWNERINEECYTPNAFARILGSDRRIDRIANNFERISFNFGPTLLSWIEKFSPRTYAKILEADRASQQLFNGHGSAIAQAYNHPILPLCNKRDQVTQVRWGIYDFVYRFKRQPESIWLPETAVNDETLRVLIDHKIKYIILSPYQAKRVRNFSEEKWQWVENGEINTTQAYRWFDRSVNENSKTSRYIDIFFYNGELSRGVGFERLASDAKNFANRISGSYSSNGTGKPQLISIATDGETYGHHERFGEMGLAYLLHVEAAKQNIQITNYGEFLENNPPVHEVEIKPGDNGEGTAWSCAHSLGRWSRNCGCRGDGPAEWSQQWRGPLREALNHLRDELWQLTVELGEAVYKDLIEARNDYIEVILNRTPETVNAFLDKQQSKILSDEDKVVAIKLMELQRNAQLMYTSCGWFFTELSGIETVQIIQYAGRAIQLAEALSGRSFEDRFLSNLKRAKSNVPEYRDGEGVYRKLVRPAVVSFIRVVNTYSIRALFLGAPKREQLYHYTIESEDATKVSHNETTIMTGKVYARSGVTGQRLPYAYALVRGASSEGVHCYIRKVNSNWDYIRQRDQLMANISDDRHNIIEFLDKNWGGRAFGLKNMFFEERQQVIELMLQERLLVIGESYAQIYRKNRGLINALCDFGANIPEELKVPAQYTLSRELRQEIENLGDTSNSGAYKRCLEISRLASKLKIELSTGLPKQHLQVLIEKRLSRLKDEFTLELCKEIQNLYQISQRLRVDLKIERLQDSVYSILEERVVPATNSVEKMTEEFSTLSAFLQLAYEIGFSTKKYKERIEALETSLAETPELWP